MSLFATTKNLIALYTSTAAQVPPVGSVVSPPGSVVAGPGDEVTTAAQLTELASDLDKAGLNADGTLKSVVVPA